MLLQTGIHYNVSRLDNKLSSNVLILPSSTTSIFLSIAFFIFIQQLFSFFPHFVFCTQIKSIWFAVMNGDALKKNKLALE